MSFHREGLATIILAFLLAIGLISLSLIYGSPIITAFCSLLALSFLGFILQFFRNPARTISSLSRDLILVPADGKVVVIEKVEEPEYFKGERIQVSIFMSPLNVHINRIPWSGQVVYRKYYKGKHLVAWNPKSSLENERCTTVIERGKEQILIRQIAGAVARRITNYVAPGQEVNQGEELGFIKFGSRVDILLPLHAQVHVQLDQQVRGNITHLATLPV